MKHKQRSKYLKQPIRLPAQSLLHLRRTEAAKWEKLAAKGMTLCYLSSPASRHCSRPFLCHSDSLWCPHSEADTATRLFGAVKVDSFAQGFLQHKERANEYLAAANPHQERWKKIDCLWAGESLGSFYFKFRSRPLMVKITTWRDS